MSDAVIVAVITAVSTVIVQLIISSNSRQQMNTKLDTAITVQQTKLDELTRQVREHNQLVSRTYKLESDVAVINEKINGLEAKE